MSAFYSKDDVDKINEEYVDLVNSKQQSDVDPNLNIHGSNITHPDEDAKEEMKKQAIMELVKDQRQQREEIDGIKQDVVSVKTNMEYLAGKMGELADGFNKMNEMMAQPQQIGEKQDQIQKVQLLSQLLDSKLGEILLSRFQPQQQVNPLISNDLIEQEMKQTFFDNLETGKSINNFIKNSLKKKVTTDIINTSLRDIGHTQEHEPA